MLTDRTAPTGRFRPTGMFRSLAVRNFRLFATGQVVSAAGTWTMITAQDWLVLSPTDDSATALAALTAAALAHAAQRARPAYAGGTPPGRRRKPDPDPADPGPAPTVPRREPPRPADPPRTPDERQAPP